MPWNPRWADGSVFSEKPPLSFFLSFCVVSFSLSPSLSLPVRCARSRGLTFTSASVLVRASIDGPGLQPTDMRDHTKCVVRALRPTLAPSPRHVCHRQETGLSPQARHMQQDMGISKAPPHLGAPLTPFTPKNHDTKKLAVVTPEIQLSLVSVATRVFRPAGRILHKWCYEQNNSQNICSCGRCRFVHHSNFRRHGMASAKKPFFLKQRHSHS